MSKMCPSILIVKFTGKITTIFLKNVEEILVVVSLFILPTLIGIRI